MARKIVSITRGSETLSGRPNVITSRTGNLNTGKVRSFKTLSQARKFAASQAKKIGAGQFEELVPTGIKVTKVSKKVKSPPIRRRKRGTGLTMFDLNVGL